MIEKYLVGGYTELYLDHDLDDTHYLCCTMIGFEEMWLFNSHATTLAEYILDLCKDEDDELFLKVFDHAEDFRVYLLKKWNTPREVTFQDFLDELFDFLINLGYNPSMDNLLITEN